MKINCKIKHAEGKEEDVETSLIQLGGKWWEWGFIRFVDCLEWKIGLDDLLAAWWEICVMYDNLQLENVRSSA